MKNELGHFEIHIVDAIRTNISRRAYYASLAGWRARVLSVLLVFSERLCRPLARYFDRKAKPFNDAGIGIVEHDFIDMALIAPMERPPIYAGKVSKATHREMKMLLKKLKQEGLKLLSQGKYEDICVLTEQSIEQLEKWQQQDQVHYAMTLHLLESLGLAALHAPGYIAESKECEPLARKLVGIQLRLCDGGLLMDRLAQSCHAQGAGILINDVPAIPFLEEWRASQPA